MGQQLCYHVKKEVPVDSSNDHSPGHSISKKLRICLDPRDLNEDFGKRTLLHKIYQGNTWKIPWYEKVYNSSDFNKGYWMVELYPESRKLTTMALDIGRFQWTRLPMGSIIAQDVFQRKLHSIFLDIPGVTGIADDMIIYGRDDQEHMMEIYSTFWKFSERTL